MTKRQVAADRADRPAAEYAAFIGIDWGDQKHDGYLIPADGRREEEFKLPHTPEDVAQWAQQLRTQFNGRPVAVALEQKRGGLVHMLMQFEHLVLFPLNPRQASCYRRALHVSGKKDDPTDARSIARLLHGHHDLLRPWRPDSSQTRRIARLCELRRKVVDFRTQTGQRLRGILKLYFPQALEIAGEPHSALMLELLRRWPTLQKLQRAHPDSLRKLFGRHSRKKKEKIDALIDEIRSMTPATSDAAIIEPNAMFVEALCRELEVHNKSIAKYDDEIDMRFSQHKDAELFSALPGAGDALAPRLLAAMGDDRQRIESAVDMQCLSGIAPVTKRSGKSCAVVRRLACSTFLKQTFHEFAEHSKRFSVWAKAYYRYQTEDLKKKHHAVLRALAYKWIRVITRLWKDRTRYNEQHYIAQLRKKQVPYAKYLPNA